MGLNLNRFERSFKGGLVSIDLDQFQLVFRCQHLTRCKRKYSPPQKKYLAKFPKRGLYFLGSMTPRGAKVKGGHISWDTSNLYVLNRSQITSVKGGAIKTESYQDRAYKAKNILL